MNNLDNGDIAAPIKNERLAAAIEGSIRAGLACPHAHLVEGGTPWAVFRKTLDAVVRDIAAHPQGILFRRLIEHGSRDTSRQPSNSGIGCDGPLTELECGKCVEFIKSHMVNRFKGDLAELLGIRPVVELLNQWLHSRSLPSDTHVYFGELIQERAIRTATPLATVQWGTFCKGADGLIVEQVPGANDSPSPKLAIHGVIEVKSMASYPKRILTQIERHITRMSGGLKLGQAIWPPDDILQPVDRPELFRIIVVPAMWALSREWKRMTLEDGSDHLITKPTSPPRPTTIEEVKPRLWRIVLEWSHEALEAAAYEMTFWYMARVGAYVYERKGLPITWQEMTLEEAGYNSVKEMLYHLPLSNLSPRADRIAIQLYNVYSFGYALGVDRRELLWPEDFPKT